MYRLIILLLLFISEQHTSLAQQAEAHSAYKIGITGGVALFSESDLKKVNTEVAQNLPFDVQTINNFPPYFCYGGYILVRLSHSVSIGPSYQYCTTGSRLGAKDYSGTYSFDQIIAAHSIGVQSEVLLTKIGKPLVFFETVAGIRLASWKLKEKLEIDDQEESDSEKLSAVKPFVFPGIKISWPVVRNLAISAKAGYSIDLGGKFSLSNNSDDKSETKVSFSGPRLSLAFEYGY